MIALRPFRAWRPAPDKAAMVGSRSYVTYTAAELKAKLAQDPYSFLHVIHPPGDQLEDGPTRPHKYHLIRRAFRRFCDEGILVRDQRPCIYVYEQHSHGHVSRGIITGVSVHAYLEGAIKVHEQTLTEREQLFTDYLEATGVNAEPVLLATPPGTDWEDLLLPVAETTPVYDFITNDGVQHRFWAIDDLAFRERLQSAFASISKLYIADGHHRLASSARLAQQQGSRDVDPRSWCLAYIVPQSDLHIYNFDRAIRDLHGLSSNEFLDRLATVGSIATVKQPRSAHGLIHIRVDKGWFSMRLPPSPVEMDPAAALDAARLSELVLGPILGIKDLRSDPRITFLPGVEGTKVLDALVNSGKAAAAFHLHPVGSAELRAVADTGGTMPPKSTYIEPKLRSGLTVYSLEDV